MNNKEATSREVDDFLNEFKDVTPLKNIDVVQTHSKRNQLAKQLKRQAIEQDDLVANNYLSLEKVDPIDPYDYISYKQNGIQDGVFKKLRLGKYKIDTVVNLQPLKVDAARLHIFNQIIEAHKEGSRTLLIKHGLGLKSKPFKGLLKSYVNQWLQQLPEVIAFHTSLAKHGGNAAVYVLLKKNQTQKALNREEQRKNN